MKKLKVCLSAGIIVFVLMGICSCGGVESKYEKIRNDASSSLTSLQSSIDEMTSYEFTKKYEGIKMSYDSCVNALRAEVSSSEKETSILDTLAKDFSSLAEADAAIESLKEKNQVILDSIRGKKWIRIDPKDDGDIDTDLVFCFKDSMIDIQGYKKKFPYEIKDGNITTESIGNIYCALTDSTLVLQDESGTEAYYRLANLKEQIMGYYVCPDNYSNTMYVYKNGTCSFPNDRSRYDAVYSFKDNSFVVSLKKSLNSSSYMEAKMYCTYNPTTGNFHFYRMYDGFFEKNRAANLNIIRSEKKGPQSLSILFDKKDR